MIWRYVYLDTTVFEDKLENGEIETFVRPLTNTVGTFVKYSADKTQVHIHTNTPMDLPLVAEYSEIVGFD